MARFLKWIGCVTLCLALAMPGALAKPLEEEPPDVAVVPVSCADGSGNRSSPV